METNSLYGILSIPKVISTAEVSYDGPYDVIPSGNIQMLLTEGKTLSENIIVMAIPYSEVTNTSGGYTAVIG
jgi:hypothetical protein